MQAVRSYRSPADIVVELLRACQGGGTRRNLLFRSCLGYHQGDKYLRFLERQALVARSGVAFEITDKGRQLLKELSETLELLETLDSREATAVPVG